MSEQGDIKKEVERLQLLSDKNAAIDTKLDELLELLAHGQIDSEKAKQIRLRMDNALDEATPHHIRLDAFKQIDHRTDREAMLDDLTVLLANNQIDSKMSKKYLQAERVSRGVLVLIGLVLITLGFAMIIMPAPPYFEMFTIIWFNPQDGITLMDVISLLVILCGVYLLVRSLHKKLSTGN
ncbi:hypothetical protein LLH06_02480 [Mucilaginibacter daejeonensis]|uniref:hypothetical protein n=1 Tax=Mucilaginibacter daejeonensis TaxID=398049 RepID=UPI001D171F68|nr:hypothetical protein [Mucilaginibacter daejeonensis]UEG53839.1 hypothetical protein LLH06_02480 [Mucilaginibacter daejeonensis]